MTLREESIIPVGSVLNSYGMKYDYVDSFSIKLDRNDVQSWEPIAAFFHSSPKWFDYLFRLRNAIVKIFGFKVGMVNLDEINVPFQVGDRFGVFELFEINETEVILGENDYHLNFRLSFLIDENNVLHTTTTIVFNNVFGKIYLAIVKPFHKFIAKYMIKKMARDINNKLLPQHKVVKI